MYNASYKYKGKLYSIAVNCTCGKIDRNFMLSLSVFSHVELTRRIIDRFIAGYDDGVAKRAQYVMGLFFYILPTIIEQQDSQSLSFLCELSGVESVPIEMSCLYLAIRNNNYNSMLWFLENKNVQLGLGDYFQLI